MEDVPHVNMFVYSIAGYFSQISTLADVQENVMRYLHVMSRPKVIDHEHDTVWTEAYVDSAVSTSLLMTSCDFLSYQSSFPLYIYIWMRVHACM